jgi:mono/diheme cytochrome c family protein/glucose/arabinose dehydrogenase/HEAT repeat protein
MKTAKGIAALMITAGLATGYAFQAGQSWPPPLQQVTDESPVFSPAESMKKIVLPPGYRLELVASEPMIQEPVAIDWDANGRLWVIEMPGYMEDMPATTELQPTGRVSVLEDTNDDGKMDKKTVFLDKLVLPRTLKVLERGVLIAEPPTLWFARDTNGDLVADSKEAVTKTYGQAAANVEHNENSLLWALDNWMYTSEGTTLIRLKDGAFDVRKTLSRGQWGATQDDGGRVYRNTNSAALFVDIVPTPYYARNPHLMRTRGSYETLDTGDLNTVWPIRPTPGVNRGYQDGVLRPDKTLAAFTAVGAPTFYRGDRLPAELYGNVFLAEPAGNLVSRIVVTDDGTTLRGKKAYERGEFMASTDERFRPVNLSSAPDGTLYVVDMYHGIIQHKGYITEYLRDQILSRKLEQPQGHGRIYRVVHTTTKRGPKPALAALKGPQLVELLAHPNGWWRDKAQELIVERGDRSAIAALKEKAARAPDWRTRLHAMWTLDGIDAIEPALVTKALEDSSRDVRASAVRIAERWLTDAKHPIQAAVLKKIDDKDWAVRRQLAATLGVLPDTAKIPALVSVLERHGDDPITVDAAVSGLTGSEQVVLQRLLSAAEQTPQRTGAAVVLAATVLRSGDPARLQEVLEMAGAPGRAPWQRDVLLEAAEAALLGGPLPGSGRRGAGGGRGAVAAAAPSTAPGGRAGPGGAPAFPGSRPGEGAAPGGRGRGAIAAVPLTREPAALRQLAASGGETGKRAEALLARLTWPGKPATAGAPAAAVPLSAAEQKRFDDGKAVYTTLCVACHQENGEGREKVAPSLIGSTFVLGPPHVPMRILINGKEGPVGLMPPLGSVLSDDQIAAVLTFVRRSWGNQGVPVDPAAVSAIRKETSGRTRPWTEKELAEISGAGK